jgi:hypothetical protein
MNLSKSFSTFLYILIAFSVVSCNQSSTQNENGENNIAKDTVKHYISSQKVKKLFYNVPSPLEITTILKNAKVEFKPELLNKIENTNKYLTEAKISMNFGVFISDLSFVRIMDKIQVAVKYLSVIKKFSDDLGIPPEKGAFVVKRMEENIDNKDSILNIIFDLYYYADNYLKDNERADAAALVIVGGWVEAMYLATNIIDEKKPDKDIVNCIAEQKLSLNNLLDFVSGYVTNNKLNLFIPPLTKLKNVYDKIDVADYNNTNESANQRSDYISNNQKKINVSSEQLIEIKNMIEKMRNDIIL